jgi:chorismate synthase
MLPDIKINAYVSSVGPIFLEKPYQELDFKTESNPVRCPDEESAVIMEEYIREIRKQGDTVGERLLVLFKMFQLV